MRRPLTLLALGLALNGPVHALDLLEAWQAAQAHAPQWAAAEAARAAGATRQVQADALWRPQVGAGLGAGVMSADTRMAGARFSAPGFGQSDGVAFGTSVHGGSATRWALQARQPLYNPERRAQSAQLQLGADAAQWQYRQARQGLMLLTAQRYLDVALAEQRLAGLRRQHEAAERTLSEARDRYTLGDAPITDSHEAAARASALQAQVLTADNDAHLARQALGLLTGPVADRPPVRGPGAPDASAVEPLEPWLEQVLRDNPQLHLQRLQADMAEQEVRRHERGAAPTLDLVAQAGRERLSGHGDFGPASTTQQQRYLGVQLNVPLYTGGWRDAKLEEALHLAEQARAELEGARLGLQHEARAAWLGLHNGQARLQALEQARHASTERLGATRLGREVGDRTTLDLLNAENDATQAELAVTQARAELLLQRLRLQALAGQLDEDALRAANARLTP